MRLRAGDFGRTEGNVTLANPQGTRRIDFVHRVDAVTYHATIAVGRDCMIRTPGPAFATRNLVIKRAEYGAGDKWADVTATIAAQVKGGRISQLVNFRTMDADPAPGRAKRLRVTYSFNGKQAETEIPDNERLCLPPAGGNAHVVSASGTNVMTLVCAFSATSLPSSLPSFQETRTAASARWESYWKSGGGDRSVRQQGPPLEGAGTPHRAVAIPDGGQCPPAVGRRPRMVCWASTLGAVSSTWR